MPHSSETLEARARMRDAGCPERPDVNAGVSELKEELEARDQRPRPAQQGMAARRRLHTRRDRGFVVHARAHLAEPESHIE